MNAYKWRSLGIQGACVRQRLVRVRAHVFGRGTPRFVRFGANATVIVSWSYFGGGTAARITPNFHKFQTPGYRCPRAYPPVIVPEEGSVRAQRSGTRVLCGVLSVGGAKHLR